MNAPDKWTITNAEKEYFIEELSNSLTLLRTKADISQEQIANIIGISRQTYGAMERKTKKMSWNTFLSLVLFFDSNNLTRKMLCEVSTFPREFSRRFNDGDPDNGKSIFDDVVNEMISSGIRSVLDEKALHAIKTVVMMEYARCTRTPGEVVVKSFGGISFLPDGNDLNVEAERALKRIPYSL